MPLQCGAPTRSHHHTAPARSGAGQPGRVMSEPGSRSSPGPR